MAHFIFTQICRICKKSSKSFKINLDNYDEHGRFLKEGGEFSFVCCNIINAINFHQICNLYTVQYLRNLNEIDKGIDQVTDELSRIRLEKLKISATDSL